MVLIQDLSYMIEDEIDGAEKYAKMALRMKDERPQLAQTFFNLTSEELRHVDILHDEVVRVINDFKNAGNEVPPDMQAVYDYIHRKQIERVHDVRMFLEQYKS